MGYGTRSLQLLFKYYDGQIPCLEDAAGQCDALRDDTAKEIEEKGLLKEKITPRKSLPPLLLKLSERPAEKLDYLGVSYGMTNELFRFWKKSGFVPVYVRQTTVSYVFTCFNIVFFALEGLLF